MIIFKEILANNKVNEKSEIINWIINNENSNFSVKLIENVVKLLLKRFESKATLTFLEPFINFLLIIKVNVWGILDNTLLMKIEHCFFHYFFKNKEFLFSFDSDIIFLLTKVYFNQFKLKDMYIDKLKESEYSINNAGILHKTYFQDKKYHMSVVSFFKELKSLN